jgi:hypothetical protein
MKKSLLISVLATAILLVGAVAYATADTVVVNGVGSPLEASDTVTVNATVNSMLTLTVTTPDAGQSVDFGAIDPGASSATAQVDLSVQSNRAYDLSVAKTGDAAIGLTTSPIGATGEPATASQAYTDTYQLVNVPWTTTPGAHSATVLYTVTQN